MSSGIAMVLNTAKQALSAQQIGLNVTGHNIANVNTPAFSRQSAVQVAQLPINIGGLKMGTGVNVDTILRSSDQLLEGRLVTQQSILSGLKEAESYIDVLENLFNETSEDGISKEIASLWNTWQDLSNNPTGVAERQAIFDAGVRFSERINTLSADIRNLESNTNMELEAAVSQVNTLTSEIAAVNMQVIASAGSGAPNDQLDTRNGLLQKLSELIDIKVFEQPNGAISVSTGSGHTLVYQSDTFSLSMSGGDIFWEGSMGSQVDITDKIAGGKMAGWLNMRDEEFPKYRNDLDALAKEVIRSVNLQHSRGAGVDFFDTAVTGTYATDSSQMLSTLPFGDQIDYSGDFRMWVHDNNTSPPMALDITVDMGISTSAPAYGAGGTAFKRADTAYTIKAVDIGTDAGTVGGADDIIFKWENDAGESGTATLLAGNTFMTLDDVPASRLDLAAGKIVAGNTLTVNTDSTGAASPLDLTIAGTGNSLLDTYKFKATTGGTVGGPIELEWSSSMTSGTVSLDATTMTATVDGMTLTFNSGTLATGEVFTLTTDAAGNATAALASDWHWTLTSFRDAFNNQADAATPGGVAGDGTRYITASVTVNNTLTFTPVSTDYTYAFSDDGADGFTDSGLTAALGINTFFDGFDASTIGMNRALNDKDLIAAGMINGDTGELSVGDNRNAIALADIQYESREMVQWTFERGKEAASSILSTTSEGYFQGMVGSLGIKAASIRRDADFNEVLTNRIRDQRDSVSGVNLDEEMVNLMKYQHAYAMASKLLGVADEMLTTLIASR
jgi:flagellar hook-associated protein FlgK